MPDDKRQFALQENGTETSIFRGSYPRQAALKAARRLGTNEPPKESNSNSQTLRLRELGTVEVHVYEAWTWKEATSSGDPDWLGESVTRANVSKLRVESVEKSERELNYDQIRPLLLDQPITITQQECGSCGSPLENAVKQVVPVKEVPESQTVQYNRYHYRCEQCGSETTAQTENCPSFGGYGINLLAQAVLFRYEYRIPYRKIARLFGQLYDCEISEASVLHLCERMTDVARSEYREIRNTIRSADILYVDETPHAVGGDTHWLWAFTTDDETLFAFRATRSSTVLQDVLGDAFSGIIACDGNQVYPAFHSRLQRCWTHLLRGSDQFDEDDTEVWFLYRGLLLLFNRLKAFLDTDPSPMQRICVQQAVRDSFQRIADMDVDSEDAADLLTMLGNGIGNWLTFLDFPAVEPTNYKVEALLREPIVLRRIIGTLRNKKGMRLHETFLTLIHTWRRRGYNPYSELQRLARNV